MGSAPAGGINTIQHSFLTTNVAWWWVPVSGQSAVYGSSTMLAQPYEASSPTATQLTLAFHAQAFSGASETAGNVYGRLHILQTA